MLPDILDGATTTPTSSFPYRGFGPIDFSQINFVKTEQTEYYYGYPDASATQEVLLAKVTQTYDPTLTFFTIFLMIAGFIWGLIGFIKFVRKQGKN